MLFRSVWATITQKDSIWVNALNMNPYQTDCNTVTNSMHETFVHENDFVVFPNPATNQVQIKIASTDIAKVQLLDLSGKVFTEENFSSNLSTIINLNGIAKGIYLIRIVDKNGKTGTKKLIISE